MLENDPRPRPETREVRLDIPEPESEEELLESCRRGDVAAFETLYERHGTRMKSIARNLLGRETDAEDAVQETFLKVYRGAASFRGSAALSTWIYRILVNTCYDAIRRRRRHPEEALEPGAPPRAAAAGSVGDPGSERSESPAIPAPAGDHALRLAIEQSLGKLAPRQRTVFLLSAVEGFSHREIAHVLDVSEGASRTLLFEAKRRLQELLWAPGGSSLPTRGASA